MSKDATSYFLKTDSLTAGESVFRFEDIQEGWGWLHFKAPIERVIARTVVEILSALERISIGWDREEYWTLALNFDAGRAFDHALESLGEPLLTAYRYDRVQLHHELFPDADLPSIEIGSGWARQLYEEGFRQVKDALGRGECYQANLTFGVPIQINDPWKFFVSRTGVQAPPFASFWRLDEGAILSFSPELFFETKGDQIWMQPMKGTSTLSALQDLGNTDKDKAENLMIVDMIRNDLGRVCKPGSVRVEKLFERHAFHTIGQMTSTISGTTKSSLLELLRALFPSASVTGAPKVQACKLLSQIESGPRGLYTGMVGWIGPSRRSRFSVAIRTVQLDELGHGTYGVGSGIVWDSEADAEFEECLLKLQVLRQPSKQWRLLETMGPDHGKPQLKELHQTRLDNACETLSLPQIHLPETEFSPSGVGRRISVEYDIHGAFVAARGPSVVDKPRLRAAIQAVGKVGTGFKTNSRSFYEFVATLHPGFDEVLLVTNEGELIEFLRGAVLLKIDEKWFSSAPASYAVPSVGLALFAQENEVKRCSLGIQDVSKGDLFLINAVGGPVHVTLDGLVSEHPIPKVQS